MCDNTTFFVGLAIVVIVVVVCWCVGGKAMPDAKVIGAVPPLQPVIYTNMEMAGTEKLVTDNEAFDIDGSDSEIGEDSNV